MYEAVIQFMYLNKRTIVELNLGGSLWPPHPPQLLFLIFITQFFSTILYGPSETSLTCFQKPEQMCYKRSSARNTVTEAVNVVWNWDEDKVITVLILPSKAVLVLKLLLVVHNIC